MSNPTTDEFYDQLIDQGFLEPEYLQEWCIIMRDKLRDLHSIQWRVDHYSHDVERDKIILTEKWREVHGHNDHLEGLVKK